VSISVESQSRDHGSSSWFISVSFYKVPFRISRSYAFAQRVWPRHCDIRHASSFIPSTTSCSQFAIHHGCSSVRGCCPCQSAGDLCWWPCRGRQSRSDTRSLYTLWRHSQRRHGKLVNLLLLLLSIVILMMLRMTSLLLVVSGCARLLCKWLLAISSVQCTTYHVTLNCIL
jgi:hypothetical protein